MKRLIAILAVLTLATGCSEHRSSSTAQVMKDSSGKYEMKLDVTEWSMGGPCNLTWPYRIFRSDWIYTDKLDGEIAASSLILTYERGKIEYPWPQQALRGSVTFSSGRMHVALQRPVYVDGVSVDHYEPYPMNGDYKLEVGFAAADLSDAAFVLGPKKFRDGDAIVIQQVQAASPKLEVGDKVVVRGRYVLTSEEKAVLGLFVTQSKRDGKETTAPTQTLEVKQGSGQFELVCEVNRRGVLHVTFYGIPGGKPFGGLYFGTAPQMAAIKDWTLSDYEK